jgi:hypothetical protein
MTPEQSMVVTGSASEDGQDTGGWFIGHFISAQDALRRSPDVEVKWGVHSAGETKSAPAFNWTARTLSVLVSGAFRIEFDAGDAAELRRPGDYALWTAGVAHRWTAVEDSVVLTVRWPSRAYDQQPIDATARRTLDTPEAE